MVDGVDRTRPPACGVDPSGPVQKPALLGLIPIHRASDASCQVHHGTQMDSRPQVKVNISDLLRLFPGLTVTPNSLVSSFFFLFS